MKTKAKEQDSLMQKMFPQQLNTPCALTTVIKVTGLGLHFSLMMVAFPTVMDFRVSKELGL